MTLEHVQAQQHVHGLLAQHCETRGQMIVLDLQLHHVNATQYGLCAHALCHAIPAGIDQTLHMTTFGAVLAHDCRLGARVHKCLHRHTIHLAVDVPRKKN